MSGSAIALFGLMTATIRNARGMSSCRRPSRFPPSSTLIVVSPVTLPPGRLKLAMRPSCTGSPLVTKTIGIVVVARLAARTAAVPNGATMTANAGSGPMLVRASDRCCCLHSGIRWPRCDPRRSRPQAVAECRQENACRLRRVNVEISHHGHRRLLRTRTERPSRSATDKRDELSPFKLTKLHPLPLAQGDKHSELARIKSGARRNAAFRPALDRFGS
jgi:hypothetical protein